MKFEARFRRRANLSDDIGDLNARILSHLSDIDGLWESEKGISDAKLDTGSGESAAADMSLCLRFGMKGAITYASRLLKSIPDKAIYDDSLVIQIDTDTVAFAWFCRSVFPEIIKIFSPYRANIVTDLDQDLDDFENIVEEAQRTGKDVDGRDTVFRIHPANYFDEVMCVRAFGISGNVMVEKLAGSIALAENFQSGALLILIDEPVTGGALIALDTHIRRLLEL